MSATVKNKWATPRFIDQVEAIFPAKVIGHYLPKWDDIPEDFRKRRDEFTSLASEWFFRGLEDCQFADGIDRPSAVGHLQACLGSFEPKHEHKIAGVAYLMSLWGFKATKKKRS